MSSSPYPRRSKQWSRAEHASRSRRALLHHQQRCRFLQLKVQALNSFHVAMFVMLCPFLVLLFLAHR